MTNDTSRLTRKFQTVIPKARARLSASSLFDDYRLCWLAMISSASNARWRCDVEIGDLEAAALPSPSLVRPAKIATVDASRILKRIGKLSEKDARAVKVRLDTFLA